MEPQRERYVSREERRARREKRQRQVRKQKILLLAGILLTALLILLLSRCGRKDQQTQEQNLPENSGGKEQSEQQKPQEDNKPKPLNYTICIDPGHGYDDGGAVSDYLGEWTEKALALDMSLSLRTALEEYGFTVVMTRESDEPPEGMQPNKSGLYIYSAKNRPADINAIAPDLSVSIHCDAYEGSETVGGIGVYYYKNNNPDRTPQYAEAVAEGISKQLKEKPDVWAMERKAAYYVVRDVTAPAILVETGFVSNPEDAAQLCSAQWRGQMAQGIADGIYQYYMSLNLDN